MEELEATKEDLEIRIANEKIAKPKVTEDHLKSYFYRFRGMDMRIQKNRQMLIDSFINRIYLYDDRLVISCNHKDGEETITLEDVETALAEAGFGSDLVSFAVPKKPDTHQGIWLFLYPGRILNCSLLHSIAGVSVGATLVSSVTWYTPV